MPVAVNGLNKIFKTQFFPKFGVFRTETGQKVRFYPVFQKKVNFGFPLNPLNAKAFSKMRRNSVFYLKFEMAIKSPKMALENTLKKENEADFILFNLSLPDFWSPISKNFNHVISDTW